MNIPFCDNDNLDKEKPRILFDQCEFNEFLSGVRDIDLYDEIFLENAKQSLETDEVKNLLKMFVSLEYMRFIIIFPTVVMSSLDDYKQDLGEITQEIFYFFLLDKGCRFFLSLYLTSQFNMGNKFLISFLETIPSIGRFSPAIVLRRHSEFMEMFYLYQKTKNSFRKINTANGSKDIFITKVTKTSLRIDKIEKGLNSIIQALSSQVSQSVMRVFH